MELLEKHFGTIIGTEQGIYKLRKLILRFGLTGILVPQDKKNKDAALALKELIQKKTNSAGQSTLSSNYQVAFKNENQPYKLPIGWIWCRYNDVAELQHGHQFREYDFVPHGIPVIKITQCKSDGRLDLSKCDYVDVSRENEFEKFRIYKGDLLMALTGGTLGKVTKVKNDYGLVFQNYRVGKFIPNNKVITPEYLNIILESDLFQSLVMSKINQNAQPNVGKEDIENLPIPLPPIEEQKEIVNKIEQLMSLCDQLEEQRNSRANILSKINISAIDRLIKAENENSLIESWQFIQNQFELIFGDKKNVIELKEVILNLAMRGKLTTTDSKDNPASSILIEIENERKLLVKQKLISNQKALPNVAQTEKKYALPFGWEWVRLNEYGTWKSGSTPSRTNHSFYGGDISWVKSGEVKQGRIKETSETITEIALQKCSLHRNPIGSVLIAMYGANIGEAGVLEIEAATNQAVCACKTYSPINNEFLYYLLLSLKSNFISQGAGAAQPNISREKIINTVVPLPPINEQVRIVKQIEKLFQLADLLESKIEESLQKQNQILNSILANI